jgi:hypothetical protein
MIHSAPLDLEQFQTEDSQQKPIELDVWSYFYENGYPVEEIVEAHSIVHEKVDEENTAHIVLKIKTLSKPLDKADVAVDQTEMYCCDCGRFQYHENADLEEQLITEWGHCHHIESVDKSLKAESDSNQRELIE